jgi:hypothetical protein
VFGNGVREELPHILGNKLNNKETGIQFQQVWRYFLFPKHHNRLVASQTFCPFGEGWDSNGTITKEE